MCTFPLYFSSNISKCVCFQKKASHGCLQHALHPLAARRIRRWNLHTERLGQKPNLQQLHAAPGMTSSQAAAKAKPSLKETQMLTDIKTVHQFSSPLRSDRCPTTSSAPRTPAWSATESSLTWWRCSASGTTTIWPSRPFLPASAPSATGWTVMRAASRPSPASPSRSVTHQLWNLHASQRNNVQDKIHCGVVQNLPDCPDWCPQIAYYIWQPTVIQFIMRWSWEEQANFCI